MAVPTDRARARGELVLVVVLLIGSVIPCFWMERAGTGDLLSHVYNVWLVQQIKAGQAPGVSLASTHTNILFDILLDHLVVWFGFALGTKIALAMAVLLYTGGQIALWRAVAADGWRAVSPVALMLSYGWLYAIGFTNFYIALGLGYYAIALMWSAPRSRGKIAASVALLAAAWAAHFVAVVMIAAIIGYVVVAERLSLRARLWLMGAAVTGSVAGHFFLRRFGNEDFTFQPQWRTGAEQVWLFSDHYVWFTAALGLLWLGGLMLLVRRKRSAVLGDRVLQVYVLIALVGMLAPWGVRWISYSVTLGLLPGRIATIAAVFGCAVAARARFGNRLMLVTGAMALAFFALLHGDLREIYNAEDEMAAVVHQLPRGSRIVSDVDWPTGKVQMWHLMDRACIGYAYDFGNYEAASGHFRIQAKQGNTLLTWVSPEVDPVSTAVLLRGKGVPVYEIYDDEEGHYHARQLDLSRMPDVE